MVRVTLFPLLIEWQVGRKSESLWQWNATDLGFVLIYFMTVACFLLLFISYSLGEQQSLFGFLSFMAETCTLKHISQSSPRPPPRRPTTATSPSQTPKIKFPKLSRCIGYARMLPCTVSFVIISSEGFNMGLLRGEWTGYLCQLSLSLS